MLLMNESIEEMEKKTDLLYNIMLHCFNRHVTKDGSVIYWRDCASDTNNVISNGEHGYVWIFEDLSTMHSYSTPEHL